MEDRIRQLLALSIYHAINDGSLAVFLGALPVMHTTLNLSLIQIGTLLSTGLLSTVITQFLFGYLSDQGFTRRLLLGGLLSIALIDILFVQASEYWHVLLFYLLLRAAAGIYHPVAFSTVFRTPGDRSSAMGFQSGFGDCSIAFAMFSTGFLAESLGWQIPFLAWGLAGLIGALAFAALAGLRHIAVPFDSPRVNATAHESQGITRRYLVLQFSTLFMQSLYLIFTGFIPLFLNVTLQLSPGLSALLVAVWLAIGVTSSFNAGRFVRFFGGEQRTLRISFALTALMLVTATLLGAGPVTRIATLAVLALSGVPFFLSFPVLYGIVGTTAPENRLGLAYATNLSLSLVGGSALLYVAGYLASIFGLFVVFPMLVAIAVAGSLVVFLA